MKNWPYAKLTKTAKEAGGPESLLNLIYENGKREGIKQEEKRNLKITLFSLLSALLIGLIKSLIDHFKTKKEKKIPKKPIKHYIEIDFCHSKCINLCPYCGNEINMFNDKLECHNCNQILNWRN